MTNYLKSLLGCLLAVTALNNVYGQTDTVRVCTYNLLNYGNSANQHVVKDQWLIPIMQTVNPTIVGFNEISTAVPALYDTLKADLPFVAERGPIHNTNHETQLDVLYWKTSQFHFIGDSSVCHNLRDIVAYDLYYDYPGLATYHDTIKLKVIVAHLKASNTSQDKADRAAETQLVVTYLNSLNQQGNYIMMGDMNLYTSSELAYQNLINPANANARLNDPINQPGSWNTDPSFAAIETQSPRLAALPDGGASGGLDSRFDFILVSDAIMNGSKGIRYLPGTYTVLGNDGQHYNKALTDLPTNTAATPALIQDIYNMSDHLPVYASFAFTPAHLLPTAVNEVAAGFKESIHVANPFSASIRLNLGGDIRYPVSYKLSSITGATVQTGNITASETAIAIEGGLEQGLYILSVKDAMGNNAIFKLVH